MRMLVNQVWMYVFFFVPQYTVSNCGKQESSFFYSSRNLIWEQSEWSDGRRGSNKLIVLHSLWHAVT